MRNRLVSNVVSIAVLVALASFGGPARATTAVTSCTVSNIAFDQHVYLKCADNTTYFGFTTAEQSGCGTPTSISVDTLKIWISMLTSAFLAGKTVDVYYNQAAASCKVGGSNVNGIYNLLIR